jgi:lipopolysaccharide export system permease protein
MDAGTFYEINEGERIIFAREIDHRRNLAHGVFIQRQRGESLEIICAGQVQQQRDESSGNRILIFRDGYRYEFPRQGSGGDVTRFQETTLNIPPRQITPAKDKIKASTTARLLGSDAPEDIAELQWRFSTPLSTLLLALLGVPLSRTTPRQGKYARVMISVVIYAVYYNINAVAKSWVERGLVGVVPGAWWVQALLAGLLLVLLLPSTFTLRRRCR